MLGVFLEYGWRRAGLLAPSTGLCDYGARAIVPQFESQGLALYSHVLPEEDHITDSDIDRTLVQVQTEATGRCRGHRYR